MLIRAVQVSGLLHNFTFSVKTELTFRFMLIKSIPRQDVGSFVKSHQGKEMIMFYNFRKISMSSVKYRFSPILKQLRFEFGKQISSNRKFYLSRGTKDKILSMALNPVLIRSCYAHDLTPDLSSSTKQATSSDTRRFMGGDIATRSPSCL